MSVNGSTGRGNEHEDVVVRKAEHGWVVRGENVPDLTSAMVLADLFAADQAADDDTRLLEAVDENGVPRAPRAPEAPGTPGAPGSANGRGAGHRAAAAPTQRAPGQWRGGQGREPARGVRDNDEAERLAVTVAQLEHALASRVRVEQAIGVLAERHRLRPREAFDLLRGAARSRGRRVTEMAQDVVASAANPLLQLPEELTRTAEPRKRGRSLRRARHAEQV
jgi:hypothetical protein